MASRIGISASPVCAASCADGYVQELPDKPPLPCSHTSQRMLLPYRETSLLPPMDHGIEQRCLTVVILVGMEFVQILFAVLDCSVQQRHGTGFRPLPCKYAIGCFASRRRSQTFISRSSLHRAAVSYMRIMNTRFRWSFCLEGLGC